MVLIVLRTQNRCVPRTSCRIAMGHHHPLATLHSSRHTQYVFPDSLPLLLSVVTHPLPTSGSALAARRERARESKVVPVHKGQGGGSCLLVSDIPFRTRENSAEEPGCEVARRFGIGDRRQYSGLRTSAQRVGCARKLQRKKSEKNPCKMGGGMAWDRS